VIENSLKHNYWVSLSENPNIFPGFKTVVKEVVDSFAMNGDEGPEVSVLQYTNAPWRDFVACLDPEQSGKKTAKDCVGASIIHHGCLYVGTCSDII